MQRATAIPSVVVGAVALCCLLLAGGGVRAQPFDYPGARAPTTWANTDASLPHHVVYGDGSVARAALLRLNPAGFGPSFAFGFFCTNHRTAPCSDFLLGVAVVYCNSGALMTSVTSGIPQVVWSANRRSPVGEGAVAELTAEGDLVLRSAPGGAVVWSAGTNGRSVAGARIGINGNLVLFDGGNKTVWQSFDHPTDALLIGQSLSHVARLTANASAADWRESRIYLAVEDDGLSAYVNATPPQRYYHLGFGSKAPSAYATYTNGSLTVFSQPGGTTPLTNIQLPTVGAGTVQYMRLEHDGHLRLYECLSNAQGWAPVADVLHFFPDDGCAYPTVCGAYGVCPCSAAALTRPTSGRWTSGGPTAAVSPPRHHRRRADRRGGGARSTDWCRCRARDTSTTTPRACGPWRGSARRRARRRAWTTVRARRRSSTTAPTPATGSATCSRRCSRCRRCSRSSCTTTPPCTSRCRPNRPGPEY